MAFLCISLNNSSVDTIHILDGDLIDIDKYTIKHNNPNEILKEFPEKIDELNNRFNLENVDSDIKVRIFLSNDKEQFVMYKKHLVAFKYIIRNIEFLRYATEYDSTIFSNKINELILDETTDEKQLFYIFKTYIADITDEEYYVIVRKLCEQYLIYLEDYEELDNPTIEEIYAEYIDRKNEERLEKTAELLKIQNNNKKKNPFAVFDHPNFSRVYGQAINPGKPIFIFGGKMSDSNKYEYKELHDNCKKCFSNPVYYPLNAEVSSPLNDEFLQIYNDSLLVIINGNGYDNELLIKIKYATKKNILVLILVNEEKYRSVFEKYFGTNENVIIKDYKFKDFDSQKEFADIMAGFCIRKYKIYKEKVGK